MSAGNAIFGIEKSEKWNVKYVRETVSGQVFAEKVKLPLWQIMDCTIGKNLV
jgi:hypothetical protein